MARDAVAAVDTALLAAIRERPDDDAARLVYADWLTDRGDPRGELITVQCAMARLARDDDGRPALEARDHELRALHEPGWRRGLHPEELPGIERGYLHRGFVGRVVIAEDALADHAVQLFEAAPVLTELYLKAESATDGRVPQELARIRSLRVESAPYARACLASGHVRALGALELGRNCTGPEVVTALIAADLPQLHTLDVSSTALGNAGLAELVAWPGFARLTRFDARNCTLDRAMRELACVPRAAGLSHLGLADNPLGEAGAAAILTSRLAALEVLDLSGTGARGALARTTLTSLRRLRYGWNELSTADAHAIAGATALGGLEELSLLGRNLDHATTIDADGAAAIVGSPQLARLTTIELEQNYFADGAALVARAFRPGFRTIKLAYTRLDEPALQALADNPALASVTTLDLASTAPSAAGLAALASSRYLRPRVLDLRYTELGGRAIAKLASSPILSEVRCLELTSCNLDAASIRALARSRHLGRLLRLTLYGNTKLGDDAAAALAASRMLPRLAELNVRRTEIGEAGVRALREAGHVVLA